MRKERKRESGGRRESGIEVWKKQEKRGLGIMGAITGKEGQQRGEEVLVKKEKRKMEEGERKKEEKWGEKRRRRGEGGEMAE